MVSPIKVPVVPSLKQTNELFFVECKNSHSEEPMDGLSDLIEGTVYSYLGDKDAATRCYRNCLRRRIPSKDLEDQHVSVFALFELGTLLCNGIVST